MQRITKGSKKNYFMGTDFTYEDMEREDITSSEYKVLKSEIIQDKDCWVIESMPKNNEKKSESSYSKKIHWIAKETYTTFKTEFYDKRDKLIKTQENREWENISGSVWRAKKGLMDNTSESHKTLVALTDKKVNQPIDDKVFTERHIVSGSHTE
jgi:hypothetical protein